MDNTWYVGLSDEELSKQIGMSVNTIKKYNKSLIEKGYLKKIMIDGKEVKEFNLNGSNTTLRS